METYHSPISSIKKITPSCYENVFLEVSDLLWENNHKYIYNCKVLNPSQTLPMREGNHIALHSSKLLSQKMQFETSIEIVEKTKYKATYSLVNNTNSYVGSSKKMSLFEEEVTAEEIAIHQMNEMLANEPFMSADEYEEYQQQLEAEFLENGEDHYY